MSLKNIMKIKDGFILREVANQTIIIAVGEASKIFNGMINLNRTAKDIWCFVQEGLDVEDIVLEMKKKYNADEEVVRRDVLHVVGVLKENQVIED